MTTPEQHRHTAEKIKSGAYFSDALTWYDSVYHAPIITKAYSIVVTMVALGAIWFAISGFLALLPIQTKQPFVMTVKNLEDYHTSMKPLSSKTSDANKVVLDFLVQDYVKNRESYNMDKLNAYALRIRAQSSPEAYKEYFRYQHAGNPQSPVARFEAHTVRSVRIDSIRYDAEPTFRSPETTPTTATVTFTATEESPKEVRELKSSVKLTFAASAIEINQETYAITPMKFQVTRYERLDDGPNNR
jgi:type IV secretory pathway component VirB8